MHLPLALTLAATKAPASTWDQVKSVPKDTWINIIICVVALAVIIRLWRALKKFNEYAPYVAALLAGALIFFYWIYERSEPPFLTPVVEKLAPFFPSKGVQRDIEQKRKRGREV